MKPTITIIHDTRRAKIGGNYPVKIRVTFLREPRYYPVGIDLTKEQFIQVLNPILIKNVDIKTKNQLKEWKITINTIMAKVSNVIEKMEEFSFRLF